MKDTLIKKFFNKECSAEEAGQVVAYLKENPDIIENYLNKQEWDLLTYSAEAPEELWDLLWKKIIRRNNIQRSIISLKRISIAACLAGLICTAYYLMVSKQPPQQIAVINHQLVLQHKTVNNTIEKKLRFALQDGSVITLSPASSVSFDVPFQHNKRDIQLKGEAYFKVAKDAAKPFTVFAGSLATTAVGTAFIVSGKSENVTVKLFEGKVKIKSIEASGKPDNEIELLPGEQLNYTASGQLSAVSKMAAPKIKTALQQLPVQKKSVKLNENIIEFTSEPLPLVLDKLNEYYSTQIEYNKAEIDTISFTGTITKTDSLNIILKVIAQMNNLTVHQQNDTLFIQKPKQ